MHFLFEENHLPIIHFTDLESNNIIQDINCNGNDTQPEGLTITSNMPWRMSQKSLVSWLLPHNISHMEEMLNILDRFE